MQEVLREQGVIGIADTLVKTDPKYVNVAKTMLGRIVVVDHIDHATGIARKYHYSVRMVTLEGELLVPGGAISGGAFKNNSNLLGRRREIAELEEQLKVRKAKVAEAEAGIEAIKAERNNVRKSIEEEKAALQELFIQQNTARFNVVAAEERKNEAEQGFDTLKAEQLEIEQKVREINIDKESVFHELKTSEEQEREIEEDVDTCQKELESYREEEAAKMGSVSEWEVEYSKMLQKQEFEQTNLERIESELSSYQEELAEVAANLETGVVEIENKKHSIEDIEKTIQNSHTTQSEAELALKEKQQAKEDFSQKQKTFFSRREEISERKNALDKEVYRLQSQKEKLEEQMESQINYMWNEYEITLNSAAVLRNPQMNDIPELRRLVNTVKDDIRKLGDVNVNAIEDFKVLMERYTFLKNQHDDLIEAEKTLEGIIQELDTAMRRQFAEKFEEIKREFDKVFKELFGGGKGTLELIGGGDSDYCTAAGEKAAKYDAAFRWGKVFYSNRTIVRNSKSQTLSVLSA
jgi:chromosome segregation protein